MDINKNYKNVILSVFILLALTQVSFSDNASFTVNIPNAQGGYTAIVITQSGDGYVGPQGEYYPQFPSVYQLQNVYGSNAPNVINTDDSENSDNSQEVVTTIAPPDLPEYVQPEAPDSSYIWIPGYWAYDSFIEDYYWVPGTWVVAPAPGLIWTPGYWYWRNDRYAFSNGYWGEHRGFYGGINYGHGYEGTGTRSFNGGPGGTNAKPSFAEQTAMQEKHFPATPIQLLHVHAASNNPLLRASTNHGKPAIAATVKPGAFEGQGVVPARQAGGFYDKTTPVRSGVTARNKIEFPITHSQSTQVPAPQQNKMSPQSQTKPKPMVKNNLTHKPINNAENDQYKKKQDSN